ncbi:MAG: O-antigen ligase domain-containing protein [Bacteroidales bacterium]|nr:O-antigen ligase domain-containing protein [Bacteroidales bacterium]
MLKPHLGLWSAFFANYFVMGISRYLPGPLGLSIDGLLVLTWLSVFFSQFNTKVPWKNAWNGLTIAALIWYAYAIFQLFNPEAVSRIAWFYAMRGVSLYMLLTVPLVFILFNHPGYLHTMLTFWAWFTLLGVAKGMMQKFVGPDPWEQYWLDTIGGKTHVLSQGLRIFSFFTDSATYGGSMGFSGVVFSILALHTTPTKKRLFYATVAAAAFYGMLISGTRGAIAVPFAGFTLYAILSKKVKIVISGAIIMIAMYSFLRFTTIGNSVYEIRRFRGALDPENPSLMVRKENQKLLKGYLTNRPFGGGIGSAGNWGLRFSPGTFLAETPTDSWYVQIWAEQGRVGLYLHLGILAFILLRSAKIIMIRLNNKEYIGIGAALSSGMFGVMAASYGSGALGQMPNGLIVYMSMAFIFMMEGWENNQIAGN